MAANLGWMYGAASLPQMQPDPNDGLGMLFHLTQTHTYFSPISRW
jgi:hypothetical protein